MFAVCCALFVRHSKLLSIRLRPRGPRRGNADARSVQVIFAPSTFPFKVCFSVLLLAHVQQKRIVSSPEVLSAAHHLNRERRSLISGDSRKFDDFSARLFRSMLTRGDELRFAVIKTISSPACAERERALTTFPLNEIEFSAQKLGDGSAQSAAVIAIFRR